MPRLEVGKDLEDVCEPEEETDQYRVCFFGGVGRGLCNALGENFSCFR